MDTNSALTALEDHIAILTMLVRRMVDESGDPTGFDAQAWLDHWLAGWSQHWVIGGLSMC